MSITPRRPSWLATLGLGTAASAAIWLAGAQDVAYLGFIITAIAREPLHGVSCARRLKSRRTS